MPWLDVVATRGGQLESRHRVAWALARDGLLVDDAYPCGALREQGDRGGLRLREFTSRSRRGARAPLSIYDDSAARALLFTRSAIKTLQFHVSLSQGAGSFRVLDDRHVAVMASSHAGAPLHVALVDQLLAAAGLSRSALGCGPQGPGSEPVHNNCSGKHTAMLLACVASGWPVAGYLDPEHPVQRAVRDELARRLAREAGTLRWGVDGCGAVTFQLELGELARLFSRCGDWSVDGVSTALRVAQAAFREPEAYSGAGRFCSALAAAGRGKLLPKVGAEGVYLVAAPIDRWALAFKVQDGNSRALGPAVLHVLASMGVELESAVDLADFRRVPLRNTQDLVVGEIRVDQDPASEVR